LYLTYNYNRSPEIHKMGHSICTSDWSFSNRFDIDYELIIVTEGTSIYYFKDRSYHLYPGDILLIRPNEVHSAKNLSNIPCRFFYVHFMPNNKTRMLDKHLIQKLIFDIINKSNISDKDKIIYTIPRTNFRKIFIPRYSKLNYSKNEIYTLMEKAIDEKNYTTLTSELTIALYISQVFTLITKQVLADHGFDSLLYSKGQIPKVLQESMLYIHKNYTKALLVNEIAKKLNITPQYLTRLFKDNMGKSTVQYINGLRISKSKELIRRSTMTMQEITYSIGLDNPYYFSRLFKKYEGITPSAYKRKLDSKSNE